MPLTLVGVNGSQDCRRLTFCFSDGRRVYLAFSPLEMEKLLDLEEVGFEHDNGTPASRASKVGVPGESIGFLFYDEGPETQEELARYLAAIPRDGLFGLDGALRLLEVYVGASRTPHENVAELVEACEGELRALTELLAEKPLPLARRALNPTLM